MTVPAVEAAASAIGDRAAVKKAVPKKAATYPEPKGTAKPVASRKKGKGKSSPAAPGHGFAVPGFKSNASGSRKVIVAEFIACVVLIGLTPVLMRKPDKGKLYIPNDFVRLTAVSLLFLILALMSNGKKTARIGAAFGGLVTLGVAFNAAGAFSALGSIFTNAQSGTIKGASASSDVVTTASYTPVDLSSNPTAGSSAGIGGQSRPTTPGGSVPQEATRIADETKHPAAGTPPEYA